MAEDKDTDSAPDEGVNEPGAAARHGERGPEPDAPEEFDDSAESSDSESSESELADEAADASDDESDDDAEDEADAEDAESEESDDERELVGVGAASTSGRASGRSASQGSAGTVARSGGRAKKDRPTPRQRSGVDQPKRTTPAEFIRGAISELKKVVYPTGSQLANYFVVVLVFVLIVIAIVTALDYGFGWLMLKVFT